MAKLKRDIVGVTLKVANAASIGELTTNEAATMLQAIRLFNLEEWQETIGVSIGAIAAIAGVPREDRKRTTARLSRNHWLTTVKARTALGSKFADLTPTEAQVVGSNKSIQSMNCSNYSDETAGLAKGLPADFDKYRNYCNKHGLGDVDDDDIRTAISIANKRGITDTPYVAGIVRRQQRKSTNNNGDSGGNRSQPGGTVANVQEQFQEIDPTVV